MREMKDSGIPWIGKIPKEWTITKFKYEISDYKAGPFGSSLITEKLLDEGNILVYTPENVALQSDDTPKDQYLPEERRQEMTQFFVKPGDIVFPIVGSLGRSMMITSAMKAGIINQRLARFRLNSSTVSEAYFMWLFSRSAFYETYIDLYRRGSIIVNLTKAIVNDMPIPVPPIEEQQTIVAFLDSKCAEIDALFADIQSEIDTLEAYKRSVITEAVTKGLDKTVPMKDSGMQWIGSIPEHWKVEKVKYHLKRFEPRNPGEQMVLSVYREYGVIPKDSRDDNHNVTSDDTSKYKYVRPGNLVINKMKAWQGSMGVSDYEGIVSPAYFIYHFTDKAIYPQYLHFLFRNCYKDEFRRISGGIREGQWDLSPEAFGNTLILVPPVEEQIEIVEKVKDKTVEMENVIAQKRIQLDILTDYKKSIIYEYVTGKKEVPYGSDDPD